ncbi:unnamed protein product [Eruca vesicaria subsp. sativa]|uniref:Response regulatory domain-containing protein n=1 Tax=Eruca vesicaria subsp. sativa TaxID=29727 RepID=A0ABC8IT96_ERUVS|nr:unnamed protein product [Eruca vesicaria subsp. sativa]
MAENGGGGRHSDLPNSNMFPGTFPEGLRVLLFDEDPQYLHVLEQHLQDFQYQVTRCDEEERAMYLLCNHRNMFDIAIMEANDLDGKVFRLISEIGSEMDIPIIITSKDGSRESVTKWMMNGACDYLIKPIRPEDLRLIYKYLVKKMELMSVTVSGKAEEKAAAEKSSSVGDSIRNPNKRKGNMLQTDKEDLDHAHGSATKKRRVVWDECLNDKFLEAMKYLDTRDIVPKKILERMNVSGLTRENVASHLQKFRLSQKKPGDENKKSKRNRSLITAQGGMSSGEGNVQFPIHQINNIPQPSSVQPQNTNLNLMTQRISPLGNHHDNLMRTHQHHIPHQVPEFTCNGQIINERIVLNEGEEDIILPSWLMPNSEQMDFNLDQDPVIETALRFSDIQIAPDPQQLMYVQEPSMIHIPSFPSSLT